MSPDTITLNHLNELPPAAFANRLATLYEHSPWVVARTAEWRPFDSIKAMHATLEAKIYGASEEEQRQLISAHPDLAAKLDQIASLTDFSRAEQAKAGFAALPVNELEHLRATLMSYRERFGHPFILCVAEHDATEVLPILKARLAMSPSSEHLACLAQVARIGWHRLNQIVTC